MQYLWAWRGAWRSHLFSFPPSAASEVLKHLCQSCLVRWHGAPSSDTGAPRPYAATRHHGSHGGWVSQRKQHRQRRKTMSIIISQFFGQQTNAILYHLISIPKLSPRSLPLKHLPRCEASEETSTLNHEHHSHRASWFRTAMDVFPKSQKILSSWPLCP